MLSETDSKTFTLKAGRIEKKSFSERKALSKTSVSVASSSY